VAALVLLFVVAPIVELYVIVQVASEIGALSTIGLLILVSVVGAWLVKLQGLTVLSRLRRDTEAGRDPSGQVVNGALLLLAGLLLLAPGFVSDVLGVALLLPPVRALVTPLVLRRARRRGTVVRITGTRPWTDTIDTGLRNDPEETSRTRSAPPPPPELP